MAKLHYGSTPRHAPPVDFSQLGKALILLCAPPCIFLAVSALLSFKPHFQLGAGAWPLALLSLVPFYLASRQAEHAWRYRLDRAWPRLAQLLFLAAALGGMAFGGANYLYFGLPSYLLDGLRSYSEVGAEEASQRLMDAGRLTFAQHTRVDTDLAMSYTEGQTYCVAPITSGQESRRFDLWAAGVGCCSPGQTNFHCDDVAKPHAHSALRVVDQRLLPFFKLAVQQAEAAYHLETGAPMFFTWLEDAEQTMRALFHHSFKNFVVANVYYMGFNSVCVFAFVALFAGSSKESGLSVLDA